MHDPNGRQAAASYVQRNRLDRHDHPRLHVVLGPNGLEGAFLNPETAETWARHFPALRHVEYVAVRTHATDPAKDTA